MATSRAPARPAGTTRPSSSTHHRRARTRTLVCTPAHRTPGWRRPVRRRSAASTARRRIWIAALGAAFSVLLICVMAGAASSCAGGACAGLPRPAPTKAQFDLDRGQPELTAAVTPGRLPTADPAG